MKRERGTGSIRWSGGRAHARLSLGEPFGRRTFILAPSVTTDAAAEERRSLLADLALRLRAAGRLAVALPLLDKLAGREGARDLAITREAIEVLIRGESVAIPAKGETFGNLAERWTSGELARLYPDHVKEVNHETNAYRLNKHVLPIVGDVPIVAFEGSAGLDYAQEVMRHLSPTLGVGSRRHVAQLIHKLLSMAVFPLRLLTVHPLPRGFLPAPAKEKAKSCLYPDEDRALLGAAAVPLVDRMLYGFLHREGMRSDEAARLERSDLDLKRGAVALDKNKTDDPRAWALRPDTVRAMRAWFAIRDAQGDKDLRAFPRSFDHAADKFRAHLEAAGVDRAQLFEHSAERLRVRFHDTRATFVTLALANGRSEAWITDRTGHKSSTQIARYKRAARTVAELDLGDLAPFDTAVPELAATAATPPSGGAAEGAPPGDEGGQGARGTAADRRAGDESAPRLPHDVLSVLQEPEPEWQKGCFVAVRCEPGEPAVFRFQRGNSREGSSPSLRTTAESLGFLTDDSGEVTDKSEAALTTRCQPDAPGESSAAREAPLSPADVRMVARLAGELAGLAGAGDVAGAVDVYQRIGVLLFGEVDGADVIDFAAERARRSAR